MMRFKLFSSLALSIALAFSVVAHARSIVETQQSTAYEVPDGWSVSRWTEATGEATLKHKKTGDLLQVERYGTAGKPVNYSQSEEVSSGRTLTWEYTEQSGGAAPYSRLRGEVKLADANIRISVWQPSFTAGAIDKNVGLAAMRSIAASVKVLGARKCWPPGECPPGEVKESK